MRRSAPLLLLAFCACASTRLDWRPIEFPNRPFEDVWTSMKVACAQQGYEEDGAATDRGLKRFQSTWKSRELAFGRTNRSRVRAQMERLAEPAPAGWRVELAVERQVVKDMSRALNPRESDWSSAGQDADAEQLLLGQMLMRLRLPLAPPSRADARQ